MRIEIEIESLTVGALRTVIAAVERSGGADDAAVTFSRRRGEPGEAGYAAYVARVDFQPGPPQRSSTLYGPMNFDVSPPATVQRSRGA